MTPSGENWVTLDSGSTAHWHAGCKRARRASPLSVARGASTWSALGLEEPVRSEFQRAARSRGVPLEVAWGGRLSQAIGARD